MSDLLKFLMWWLEEAEDYDPSKDVMQYGLCHCADTFSASAKDELAIAFEKDGLDRNYPFGEDAYDKMQEYDEMHLDPNRLAWVRGKIEELSGV